jgi:hypothetical protein
MELSRDRLILELERRKIGVDKNVIKKIQRVNLVQVSYILSLLSCERVNMDLKTFEEYCVCEQKCVSCRSVGHFVALEKIYPVAS